MKISNITIAILRFLLSCFLIITVALVYISRSYHIEILKFTPDLSSINPSHWGISHLQVNSPYGPISIGNIYWRQDRIAIDHLRLHPIISEIGSLVPLEIHNISLSPSPQMTIQAHWHNHPIRAEYRPRENNQATWRLHIDQLAYNMTLQTDRIRITHGDEHIPILSIHKHGSTHRGRLDLSCLEGFQGKLVWNQNHQTQSLQAKNIHTPWCSIEQAEIRQTFSTDNWDLNVKELNCADILTIPNAQAMRTDASTQVHVVSNLGNLHASIDQNNQWQEMEKSQFRIETSPHSCLIHQDGHRLCAFPDSEHYLRATGPFSSNTRPWKGMLVHIGLEGDYDIAIKSNELHAPLSIHLNGLKGDLDHLAKVFFMRIRYQFDDGHIHLHGSLNDLQGEGVLHSPQGSVNINALWRSMDEGLQLDLNAPLLKFTNGENNLKGQIDISLYLASLTRLTGNINIHGGSLLLKPMSNVTTLHEDVHIVGESDAPKFAISLGIRIQDKLKVHGMGIHGQLEGWLNIMADSNIEQSILGELNMTPASFRVFGREIILDDVQINWLNQSWNKANIDILAHKKVNANLSRPLKVDLSIEGPWDQPMVQLNSNQSSVSELQILSHLFSRSITSDPAEDAAIIEAVKNNPGHSSLLKLLSMVDRIERGLGLDLFEIGGIDESMQTSMPNQLTVGKLIHPKLMLKYKMSLDSTARNHITLDYNVYPHINIELDTDQQDAGIYLLYEH